MAGRGRAGRRSSIAGHFTHRRLHGGARPDFRARPARRVFIGRRRAADTSAAATAAGRSPARALSLCICKRSRRVVKGYAAAAAFHTRNINRSRPPAGGGGQNFFTFSLGGTSLVRLASHPISLPPRLPSPSLATMSVPPPPPRAHLILLYTTIVVPSARVASNGRKNIINVDYLEFVVNRRFSKIDTLYRPAEYHRYCGKKTIFL